MTVQTKKERSSKILFTSTSSMSRVNSLCLCSRFGKGLKMKKKELENLLYQIKKKFNIVVIYNKEKKEYDIRCMELEKYKKKLENKEV